MHLIDYTMALAAPPPPEAIRGTPWSTFKKNPATVDLSSKVGCRLQGLGTALHNGCYSGARCDVETVRVLVVELGGDVQRCMVLLLVGTWKQ
jgi:hypothetical protein